MDGKTTDSKATDAKEEASPVVTPRTQALLDRIPRWVYDPAYAHEIPFVPYPDDFSPRSSSSDDEAETKSDG
jgi:hypothetical protein